MTAGLSLAHLTALDLPPPALVRIVTLAVHSHDERDPGRHGDQRADHAHRELVGVDHVDLVRRDSLQEALEDT